MEWVLMYSGRPSSSRPINRNAESSTSIAEKERKQAEDFINDNLDVPLEELAAQNKELQRLKIIEYHKMKARKCPTLDEQPRGPDGRIIFSEEYIDFMLYRDLQPLVDLRILKHTEIIIQERIRERDAAKKGNLLDCVQEPTTSPTTCPKA
ncbi:uncharacterized protein CELE_M03B6.1 [Caenorhabditis elegans]|uniref:Uncharacterized protein n=1 Tax=Caenorhabditis elegans TaxID=6239 RepID=Q93895_CAEEL|nr:Uncharacterized protein CELE_M03B6.1 [Caenorhabditis elegans]CAB01765.1 Uncharacterized protein CELE_M03B6.1 [Caenorhabditis elegans]|eukprot:NP_510307.1 Uncharacterized protein CELE_M03B6.1 [Caenorhabditis elegans]